LPNEYLTFRAFTGELNVMSKDVVGGFSCSYANDVFDDINGNVFDFVTARAADMIVRF
jgi:hypothetical protein